MVGPAVAAAWGYEPARRRDRQARSRDLTRAACAVRGFGISALPVSVRVAAGGI